MNPITNLLSSLTGLPEPTLRLLLTIVLAYPVSIVYNRKFLDHNASPSDASQRTRFILASGFALNFFFNGISIWHSVITIIVSYAFCYFIGEKKGDRRLATASVWLFNSVYLLAGYLFMQTDDYDIDWTMTQCILCLRLMGFGFDYYDGRKIAKAAHTQSEKEVNQTAIRDTETKKSAAVLPLSFMADTPLIELPSLIDVFAYAFYPSAFLVGPQFSFSLFKKWINSTRKELTNEQADERERAQTLYVWRCVILSIIYLGLQQTVGAKYSSSYLLTEEYSSLNLFKRIVILGIAGRLGYIKYVGIWLLTEGATASFGISYEGTNLEGHALYGGLANAHPSIFETATSLDHVISAFNVNTNLWSKYYVFKRLKFLGNKQISQFGTLFFLAVWHGFHFMYFSTFLLEFLYVQCEKILCKRLVPHVQPYIRQNDIYNYLWKAIAWCACQMCVTYSMVGFELLKVNKAIIAYKNVYFLGHFAIAVIFIANMLMPKSISQKKKSL